MDELSSKAIHSFLTSLFPSAMVGDLDHENDRLQGRFEQFREVVIADMTVITLYQSLFGAFPAGFPSSQTFQPTGFVGY